MVDAPDALREGAPLLWDEAPGNLAFRFERGDPLAAVAAGDRRTAAHVVEIELVNNRLVVVPIEPRAPRSAATTRQTDSLDLVC